MVKQAGDHKHKVNFNKAAKNIRKNDTKKVESSLGPRKKSITGRLSVQLGRLSTDQQYRQRAKPDSSPTHIKQAIAQNHFSKPSSKHSSFEDILDQKYTHRFDVFSNSEHNIQSMTDDVQALVEHAVNPDSKTSAQDMHYLTLLLKSGDSNLPSLLKNSKKEVARLTLQRAEQLELEAQALDTIASLLSDLKEGFATIHDLQSSIGITDEQLDNLPDLKQLFDILDIIDGSLDKLDQSQKELTTALARYDQENLDKSEDYPPNEDSETYKLLMKHLNHTAKELSAFNYLGLAKAEKVAIKSSDQLISKNEAAFDSVVRATFKRAQVANNDAFSDIDTLSLSSMAREFFDLAQASKGYKFQGELDSLLKDCSSLNESQRQRFIQDLEQSGSHNGIKTFVRKHRKTLRLFMSKERYVGNLTKVNLRAGASTSIALSELKDDQIAALNRLVAMNKGEFKNGEKYVLDESVFIANHDNAYDQDLNFKAYDDLPADVQAELDKDMYESLVDSQQHFRYRAKDKRFGQLMTETYSLEMNMHWLMGAMKNEAELKYAAKPHDVYIDLSRNRDFQVLPKALKEQVVDEVTKLYGFSTKYGETPSLDKVLPQLDGDFSTEQLNNARDIITTLHSELEQKESEELKMMYKDFQDLWDDTKRGSDPRITATEFKKILSNGYMIVTHKAKDGETDKFMARPSKHFRDDIEGQDKLDNMLKAKHAAKRRVVKQNRAKLKKLRHKLSRFRSS